MAIGYAKPKFPPLTDEEIKEKHKESLEELDEVLAWQKEEKAKLADENSSPQKKGAAKRALKKVARRIDTVKGQIIYWELRVKGVSHFKASIEKNEYWAECKERDAKEEEAKLPELLKKGRKC